MACRPKLTGIDTTGRQTVDCVSNERYEEPHAQNEIATPSFKEILHNMAKAENRSEYLQPDSSVVNNTLNSRSQMIDNRTRKMPFVIGVAGGTCCGKSEVCNKILKHFGQANHDIGRGEVIILKQESFYRNLSDEEVAFADNFDFNFDHPDAFDEELMLRTLKNLKKGEIVQIPKYNVKTHSRDSEFQTVYPADVVLFEGILVLYHKGIRNLMDLKVFVDTDSDTRLARRVLRDTSEHNRDIDKVLNLYTKFVKQSFEEFTLPTKKYADVIIPRGADNTVAIDLIVQHIKDLLSGADRSNRRVRVKSESGTSNSMRPH